VNFRLAWRTIAHQKLRTTMALSAISFAVVLLFLQLALYDSCELSAYILLDMLDFDAILIGKDYSSLQQPGSLPRSRLYQALGLPGVGSASPVYMGILPWRNVRDGSRHPVLVLGVAPGDPVFLHEVVREQLYRLEQTDRVLLDQQMLPMYGPARVGLVSQAGGHTVTVAGLFRNGAGFDASGLLVASDQTFNRLGFSLETPALGLIKLQPQEDLPARVAALRQALPRDVRVLTREELGAQETYYWTKGKPIGIMFSSGVFVGIIVAAVILYQVLAADIARRLREFATMKAMGFSNLQINLTVLQQSLLLMFVSFGLGLALSFGLYAIMEVGTGFPMKLTFRRASLVFGLILLVSLTSGALALRKLRAADPAELF
jgi:putative ABC transport system permease protein